MKNSKISQGILAGIVLGAAAGVVAGILLAPEKGKDTREKLKNKVNNLKTDLEKKGNEWSSKAKEFASDLEQKIKKDKGDSGYHDSLGI